MVTTYSARLLNLPIVAFSSSGTVGKKRRHVEATSNGDGNGGRGNGTHENLPMPSKNKKRPAPSPGHFYAHVPPHHGDTAASKRRRQREEWQYAAATVQQALKEAGRPPANALGLGGRRAPPGGSSDAGGARAVASSAFAREEGAAAAREWVERKPADEAREETQVVDDPYGYGDVSSMYMIASLIQSTQGYYGFEAKAKPEQAQGDASTDMARAFVEYDAAFRNSEKAPSEDSEALSSWSPSGPSNDLNDNRRKDVDDDNRSDGQSSCPDCADGGEEEGSLSSEDPTGLSGRSSPGGVSSTPKCRGAGNGVALTAFSIVG